MDYDDLIRTVINPIKGLQEYEVQVTVPEDFTFKGAVPYDMYICNDQAFVRVTASSVSEARQLAEDYFNNEQSD